MRSPDERVSKRGAFNTYSGSIDIPESLKEPIRRRLLRHAEKHYASAYARLDIRFKGPFCYVDAYTEPDMQGSAWTVTKETREEFAERLRSTPIHLCRLRYFSRDRWSVALHRWRKERYKPALFESGDHFGTPEEALDVGAIQLPLAEVREGCERALSGRRLATRIHLRQRTGKAKAG
jgi:hypothetical protein